MSEKDNKRRLYDALSKDYDMGTFEQFSKDIQDDGKRKKLYDAISEDYELGDYDSFNKQLGVYIEYPEQSSLSEDIEAFQSGNKSGWRPTEQEKIQESAKLSQMKHKANQMINGSKERLGTMQEYRDKAPLGVGQTAEGRIMFNPQSGKVEKTFITPLGNRYTSKGLADMESFRYRQAADMSVNGQLRRAYERLSDIDNRLAERGTELLEEQQRNKEGQSPMLSAIMEMGQIIAADKMGGGAGMMPEDGVEFQRDSEYQSLRLAKRQLEEQIQQLENYTDKERNGERFLHDYGRNTWQKIADVDAWDFGKNALRDAGTMLMLSNKSANGEELTDAENDALYEMYMRGNVMNQFGDLGRGAKWGDITGGSLSFMKDFLITGGFSGLSTKLATQLPTRFATKVAARLSIDAAESLGMKVAKDGFLTTVRHGGKGVASRLLAEQGLLGTSKIMATRALGVGAEDLLIRAPLMVGTVQGQSTAAEIINTKLGPVEVNNETGELHFKNDVSWGEAAWEVGADKIIENFSEMSGAHVPGVADVARVFGARKLTAAILRATREGAGTVLSKTSAFLERAGINGFFGEIGEEYNGQLWRTGLCLDTAKDADGNNLLGNREFHEDIWGGIGMSMGLTTGVTMGINYAGKGTSKALDGAKYVHLKHLLKKSDAKAAEVLTPDLWNGMRQIIEASDNEGVCALAKQVVNDADMTEEQRAAVMEFMERTMIMRGYNLGEYVRRKNGIAPSAEVDELSQCYIDGYNIATPQEMVDAKNMMEYQRGRVAEALGEDVAREIEKERENALSRLGEDAEVNGIVLDYLNAQMVYDGMIQRVRDDIDGRIDQSNAMVNARTNRTTGMIQGATMKQDDRRVYVINGNLVQYADGSGIDIEASDNSIIVRDAETGALEQVSPDAILNIDEALDPITEMQTAADAIRQQYAQEAANRIDGVVTFNPGDTYTITGDDAQIQVQIVANDEGIVDNRDGTVNVSDGTNVFPLAKETIQQQAEAAQLARVAQFEQQRAAENAAYQQAIEEESRPQYALNDLVSLRDENGNAVRGNITTDADADGRYEVYTEAPINGKRVNLFTRDELDSMLMEHNGVVIEQPAENEGNNGGENIPENGNIAPQNIPAMQRIPKDMQGNPLYEQTDSDTAWDAIVEQTEGDEAMAQTVADGMVADKEAALKKLEKAKSKGGATVAEKIAAEKERKAAIDAAQQEVNIWKKIAGTANRRRMDAEAERRRIADEAAALRKAEEERLRAEREEAERIEREALNGVPDMVDDTPQDARARGYRRVSGHKIDRQEPLQAVQGKEIAVRFSDDAIANGRVAVIDATQLQPSHIQGVRNPLHFIDEAQPKERNDEASVMSARKIAGNIRPEEITSSVTAYTGAPTVNTRGEAIQGNNRSDALRLMWESHKDQAEQYKQYLKDHAEEFGLNADDVAAMERPVLVNMLDVDDAEAITLGQFVAQDTESGGTERIKPKNALQKMGNDMRSFANLLLKSNDEDTSFAGLVDNNGVEVLKWMSQRGYITPTQYKSAFDSKGNLTAEAKNDLRGIMYQSIFKGGSTRLEEMFNAMPAKAQKAILATAFRDYDSPNADRMIEEIQNSIRAFYALSQSEDFVNAKTFKDARLAVEGWKIQYQIDDVTGESYLPAENFSNFALLLATMYKGDNQSVIQGTFNKLYDLIQGTQEPNLFEQPDNTPRTLAQAIYETLNITYDGQQRSNVLVGDSSASQRGQQGSTGDAATGERIESGQPTADSAGSIDGDSRGIRSESEDRTSQSEENATEIKSSMSANEAINFVADIELIADVAPEIDLTIENWDALFGESGTINTPIGEVKMGENQFAKLMRQGRESKLGMIKPTLENPHAIVEEASEAKEGDTTERASSYIFIRSFKKADGSRFYYFTSITVSKDGREVVVSSQEKSRNKILRLLQEGSVIWRTPKDATTSSAERQGLDYEQPNEAETATKGSGITPQSTSSESKDTTNSPISNELEEKNVHSTIGEQIQAAEAEVNTNPTEAQKEAGNYKKGHVQIGTFNVTIEQPKGSVRSGVDADGKKWETEMQNTYGYIRGTEGVDGDHIDVFLSDDIDGWDGHKVFVVDQRNADGSFDEHKVMLGFNDINDAEAAYMSNYEEGWQGLGAITGVSIEEFEKWIASSHRKTKAFAEYKSVKTTEGQSASAEAPTISQDSEQVSDQDPEKSTLLEVVRTLYTKGKEVASKLFQRSFFDVAQTPKFMQELGLRGDKFTIKYGVIARHLGKDSSHTLTERDWEQLPQALQNPFAISKLTDKEDSYRIYTTLQTESGEFVVVGADVKNAGREIEVNAISTVFGRRNNANLPKNEEVIYRSKEITPEQSSLLERPYFAQYPTEQELSKGKGTIKSSTAKNDNENNDKLYTISPAQYTTKKGKVLDMYLVKFAGSLTKEQQRAAKELAKAEKGWYDREQGGFMMRSEESAKQLADTILNNDDAVSDAQPVSLADTRKVVKPQQVNVESLIGELNEKGEAKLSDHVEQPTNPSGNRLVTDERYAELRERMRKKLGGQMNIGIDPEILSIGTEMAVYHLEKGARKFTEYAKAMIADLGDAIRPYLKAFYNGARNLPEVESSEIAADMTPYDEVQQFNVATFDKEHSDPFTTAEIVVAEQAHQEEAEQAKQEIINQRNTERRNEDEQTSASTEAIASQAETVADKAESDIETATTEEQLNDVVATIDKQIEEVNKQLALLGYYEADIDDSQFHESYGYMRSAEKKAVKDADTLAKRIVKDLGIDPASIVDKKGKRRKVIAQANIAPAGGNVYIHLPLTEDRELYISVDLEPDYKGGNRDNLFIDHIMLRIENPTGQGYRYVGRNVWVQSDATYTDVLDEIRAEIIQHVPEFDLPTRQSVSETEQKQPKAKKSKKKAVNLQQSGELGLFDSLFDNETNNEDGLQRNDAIRSEGVSANGNRHEQGLSRGSETGSESEQQGSRGTDNGRETTGDAVDRTVRPRLSDTVTEPKNTRNNHSERGKDHAPTSVDARIEANIKAIELAKQLLESGEQATEKQMQTLRKFSGWGGLGKAFSEGTYYAPNNIAKRLRELLGEAAYQEAVMSANSAYYTPAYVVDTLWDIAEQMGFKGGNILEGSAGIGNILGQMPTHISERSDIHAIEIDGTSGGILSLLYPDAKVEIQGFEETRIANGSVDLAITNVPFVTGLRVNDTTGDKDLSKKFHNIHDFCIAKNVRKLREGGLGIFITSNGTLDNSKKLRDWIVNEGGADFVGAFRMHNKTFGGTGVTSDIIVIRKRVNGKKSANAIDVSTVSGERVAEYDTGETRKNKGQIVPVVKQLSMDYNQYFIEHPEMMAGEMHFAFEKGDTFRPTSKGLYPKQDKKQEQMLADFVQSFTAEQAERLGAHIDTGVTDVMPGKKIGELFVKDGKLYINSTASAQPLEINANKVKGHTKVECFEAYSAIKEALAEVLAYQTENESDEGLQALLDNLNKAYDYFVATYGHFNKNTAIAFLRNDVDYANVFALEKYEETGDAQGNKVQHFGKTDVFSRRVVEKEKEPAPTNVKDGIVASIFKYGRIDVPYIAKHLNKSAEEVKQEIIESGYGFEDPATRQIEVSYLYLSGNVREKLRQAQENNENGVYDRNIKALQEVMPMDIPAHLIDFTLGSSWIEPKLYEEYVKERTEVGVQFTAVGGTWFMNEPYFTNYEKNRAMGVTSEMLGRTVMGHTLIEAAIQNRSITVSTTKKNWDGSTETITDKEATQACAAKIDEIRQDFKEWARQKMQSDAEMSERMERIYNDTFNNYVPMSIPDDFVPEYFGGASHKFKMRPHQGRAIVRGTIQPLLLAHEVGTGKTFTLISTAMEMRRLGTARKPMIVVQNATVGQFVASAKELYPNAKILTLEEADRSAEGRKNFYAKIRYNDWDMIVVPQSTFEFIPDSEERQMTFVQEKIEEKMLVLEKMKEADPNGNSMITRQAEREIAALEEQLAELSDGASKKRTAADEKKRAVALQNAEVKALEMLDRRTDDVENFDDMGIDALLIDEAHEYKHLGFATAMQRGVKGVDPSYSKKSQGVFLKTQAVLEKNNGRNVIFATGTPISNTAAEIWTFMRYLMPADTMEEYGIYYFDDFVRNFGNIQQMLEFTTSGKFKENNRFAGYVNLPELVRIWSGVSDTVLTKEAGGVSDKIPEMESGKAQDLYLPQTRALRSIMKFVKAQLEEYDKMSGKEKKENSHIPLTMYGIAKAAAVDARLVQSDAEDDTNSKTNEAVRQTLRSLQETAEYKGTVAIFADNYQNKESGFNLYEDIRAKLIAEGVPANEIVVMKSGMTVKKKLEIFEKVNRGEVRVILGSTFTLGTGVNIQERLHTLTHLDAPNRPMDYTQRNGRILRQGNLHKAMGKPVRILRFGVEDSLDVTAYQRLKTKGAIADSIMNGKQMMANSMTNRVLEEEEDVFGDTVAQLSGSEYAMLKNNAEKNVRKYASRKKQWEADQTYIHNAKPRVKAFIKDAEKRIEDNSRYLEAVRSSFPDGKFTEIIIGKHRFASVDAMEDLTSSNHLTLDSLRELNGTRSIDDFFKEHNKSLLAEMKQMKDGEIAGEQKRQLTIQIGDFSFVVTTKLTRQTVRDGATLFNDVERKMTYSCAELGIEDIPVRQNLLRNAIEDITHNVITGRDFSERLEAAERSRKHNEAELEQLLSREGKPFEYEAELEQAKAQYEEYAELMKKELEQKEAKYAEMDADVEVADNLSNADEDDVLYRSDDIKDRIEALFNQAISGEFKGKPISIGRLTDEGKAYLEHISGITFKEYVDFVLNPSDLMHIYKDHFGNNEKDKGQNIPLDIEDIRSLADVISSPDKVVFFKEGEGSDRNMFYFFKEAEDGTYNLMEIYSDRKGNLTAKTFYKTKKDATQRVMDIEKSLLPTSETYSGAILSDAKIPQMFESTSIDEDYYSRDGVGTYTDDELALKSDPVSKALGKPRGTRKQRREFAQRERQRMVERVERLAKKLHLDNVEVVTDASQLTPSNQLPLNQSSKLVGIRSIAELEGKKQRAKGFYTKSTGKITIVIPNHSSAFDVEQTLLHEAVAHYGLRQLFGEHFETFLDNVFNNADEAIRKRIVDIRKELYRKYVQNAIKDVTSFFEQAEIIANLPKKEADFTHTATEEYLASLAEQTNFEALEHDNSWWMTIKRLFLDMLEKIGFSGFNGVTLSDNELRYLLWRSYENLVEPGRYRSILGEVADVAKQYELKVGNYSQEARRPEVAAEGGEEYLAAVNERFNTELQQQIDGTLPKGHIYQLGMPSEILHSAGLPKLPIELAASRLSDKSMQENHPFELSEVKGLVESVQNPLAVFRSATHIGSFVVLTELQHNGKNYVVAIEANRKQGKIEVNSIRSVHYRNSNTHIANWIQDGLLEYADKQRMSEWFSKQQYNSADVRNLFRHSAKVVESFENPIIYDDKLRAQKVQEAIKKYKEHFSGSKDLDIVVINKPEEIYDFAIKMGDSEEDARKAIENAKNGKTVGGSLPGTNKILIFADTETNSYVTLFHEHIHYAIEQLGGMEQFETLTEELSELDPKLKKWVEQNYTEIKKEKDIAEEMIAYSLEFAIYGGAIDYLREYLPEESRTQLDKILNKVGYDREQSNKRDYKQESERHEISPDSKLLARVQSRTRRVIGRRGGGSLVGGKNSEGSQSEKRIPGVGEQIPKDETLDEILNETGYEREIESDDDILFRDGDSINVREEYDKRVRTKRKAKPDSKTATKRTNILETFHEAYLAGMRSLRVLQEVISKASGKLIEDFENAYMHENHLSSRNKTAEEAYLRDFFNPLCKVVAVVCKGEKTAYKELLDYLIAKHGLERNVYMRNEATKNGATDADQTDYAGLTALTGMDNVADAEAEAQRMVNEYEQAHKTDDLWKKINAATAETLKTSYEGGLISKDTYNKISSQYKYYIPLKGWEETTAIDVYEYASGGHSISPALMRAYGRGSIADDPLATIMVDAQKTIMEANRNMMKQKFLNLALNHQSDLLTVSRQWYVKQPDGSWLPNNPVIPANASADMVDAIVKQHEADMKALEANGDAETRRSGLHLGVISTNADVSQHVVKVKRNGEIFCIYVNGDPRAAQAINGMLNPDAGEQSKVKELAQQAKDFMTKALTSWSPEFVVGNLSRDVIFAGIAVRVKEDGKYAKRYSENISSLLVKFSLLSLVYKWEHGTLVDSNEIERYFKEFMINGGETGFTQLNTIEKAKKEMARVLRDAQGGVSRAPKKALRKVVNGLEFLNRSAEDVTRFAVYMTSRQMGRSTARSVADAKEITVNFNRKGSGELGAKYMNFLYFFFNAAMQAVSNAGRLIKNHPIKASIAMASFASAGFLAPLASCVMLALWGDDDDDYWNLPEWVRRNNLVLYIPFTKKFITIPLPHELRPFYGMGEIAFSVMCGKETMEDGIWKAIEGFTGILPMDYTGNGGDAVVNLTPSLGQPAIQVARNVDYFGKPIYKETPWNKEDPEWTKAYKGTNPTIVELTRVLSEAGSTTDEFGVVDYPEHVFTGDVNPAMVEHLLESYTGGLGKTVNGLGKTLCMLWDEDYRELRNVPIARKFIQSTDERAVERRFNNEYFKLQQEYTDSKEYLRELTKLDKSGAMGAADRVTRWLDREEGKRYLLLDNHFKYINRLNRYMDEDIDESTRAYYQQSLDSIKHKLVKLASEKPEENTEELNEAS